jgi:hypothetical protein
MPASTTLNPRFGTPSAGHAPRTLRFENYLTPALAPPPASVNVLERVYQNLGISDPKELFPADYNVGTAADGAVGDCTIAALAHAITVYRGLIGQNSVMSADDVKSLYLTLTNNHDTGLNEQSVLNYWSNHVVGGDQILAYTGIDPKNHTHVKQAIQLFGGVYVGFTVTSTCENEFDQGQPWTPGQGDHGGEGCLGGHAVFAVEYDAEGVTVLTWGTTQRGTWAWWDDCVTEAYAIIPPEATNPAFAPGFNIDQLQDDLKAITG